MSFDLVNPPAEVRQALRFLSNTSDEFKVFLVWLAACREDQVITLSVARDQWSVGQAQGSVQTLDGIKRAVEVARR